MRQPLQFRSAQASIVAERIFPQIFIPFDPCCINKPVVAGLGFIDESLGQCNTNKSTAMLQAAKSNRHLVEGNKLNGYC
jgi:hypothetical protein